MRLPHTSHLAPFTIVAGLIAADGAEAAPSYFSPFDPPLFLVAYSPESGTGVVEWHLVTEERRRAAPAGMRATVLGGPYDKRMDVELDRNRLADEGHSVAQTVRVTIDDGNGGAVDSFQLGAKPAIVAAKESGPLTGDVDADLTPASPEAFPLPFTFDDYVEEYRRLKEEAALGQLAERPPDLGVIADRMEAVVPLSGTATIGYRADCDAQAAGAFGGDPQPYSTDGTVALAFARQGDGQVEITDPANPGIRFRGGSDANGGFDAVFAQPELTVNVAGVMVADSGGALLGGGIATARIGSGQCDATWAIP